MALVVDEEQYFARTVKMIVHMDLLIAHVLVVSRDESLPHMKVHPPK
jgi:hypothetical protein